MHAVECYKSQIPQPSHRQRHRQGAKEHAVKSAHLPSKLAKPTATAAYHSNSQQHLRGPCLRRFQTLLPPQPLSTVPAQPHIITTRHTTSPHTKAYHIAQHDITAQHSTAQHSSNSPSLPCLLLHPPMLGAHPAHFPTQVPPASLSLSSPQSCTRAPQAAAACHLPCQHPWRRLWAERRRWWASRSMPRLRAVRSRCRRLAGAGG